MTGANIVRMHHLDVVAPWTDFIVRKNLFGGQSPETTRVLDKEMLDRFDYLVSCFKKRGIYIFLSHLSSRKSHARRRHPRSPPSRSTTSTPA